MKQKLKSGLRYIGLLAILASASWALIDSEAFRDCEYNRKNNKPYEALRKESGVLIKAVTRTNLVVACSFVFANENTGAVSGIAGVLVAIFTFTLWRSTERLWRAGEQQIATANRQADIAERALAFAQRPWITVDVRIVEPMTYGANGAQFGFEYIIKNVGNSPAMRVIPHPLVYCKTKPMPDQDKVLTEYMASMGDPTSDPMGFTISPNDKEIILMRQFVSYDDIRATVESYRLNGRTPAFMPLYLVGFATYRSALAPERHETTFFYDILRLNDSSPRMEVMIRTTDVLINTGDLVLRRSILFSPHMT